MESNLCIRHTKISNIDSKLKKFIIITLFTEHLLYLFVCRHFIIHFLAFFLGVSVSDLSYWSAHNTSSSMSSKIVADRALLERFGNDGMVNLIPACFHPLCEDRLRQLLHVACCCAFLSVMLFEVVY